MRGSIHNIAFGSREFFYSVVAFLQFAGSGIPVFIGGQFLDELLTLIDPIHSTL